jgi:hypothetical protein
MRDETVLRFAVGSPNTLSQQAFGSRATRSPSSVQTQLRGHLSRTGISIGPWGPRRSADMSRWARLWLRPSSALGTPAYLQVLRIEYKHVSQADNSPMLGAEVFPAANDPDQHEEVVLYLNTGHRSDCICINANLVL